MSVNPLGAYVVALRLMYGLSKQKWSKQVELIESGLLIVVESTSYNAVIYTSDTDVDSGLTAGLCVQALLLAVNGMATRNPGFYQSSSYILKDGTPIGRVLITNLDLSQSGTGRIGSVSNGTSTNKTYESTSLFGGTKTTSPVPTLAADSGSLIDPEDKDFVIHYRFEGHKLPVGDIYNAAVDGLAQTAQVGHNLRCDFITTLSITRNVIWHVGHVGGDVVFGYEIARVFFLLVTEVMLVQKRFQEMWIKVTHEGVDLMDGYILKWDEKGEVASE